MLIILIIVILIIVFFIPGIRILNEYQRAVVFRLGRYSSTKGPGIILLLPFIDKMVKVDIRTVTLDIPSQEIITKDNIPVQVNAVCYFNIMIAENAIIKVQNYYSATLQISQTTLRSVCGELELDEILSERERLNQKLQQIIDEHTTPWGIKITAVEVKDVQIPQSMQRAFASQAEAERERRAKVIIAEGEYQASEKLAQAAEIISGNPIALQLRYLQTIKEAASEKNSIILAPIPLDVFKAFEKIVKSPTKDS
jgi:regulator of protease activity HflC (stomatin/prohibitin superfamily)